MSIDLPRPIALYVAAENAGETALLDECFTAAATVRDEGQTYRGLAAIREWKAETKRKYKHRVTPLELVERDGITLLKARLEGDFPGSPATLQFRFKLEGDRIAALEIGA
jgi:SnoaL-like domain